ncbi:hypothetical protein DIPPA_26213 [Diplonema papillatum]|nr:hypothetical protein DIPPA_26213 [Diplonema papillatum]
MSYYDKWKQSLPAHDAAPAAGQSSARSFDAMVDGQVDALRTMESRLHSCQSMLNQLTGRVGEVEQKTEASTRLVQLTQHMTEQTNEESSTIVDELKARHRRQEDVIKKLITDVERLSTRANETRNSIVSESHAVDDMEARLTQRFNDQLQMEAHRLQSESERRMQLAEQDVKNDMTQLATKLTKGMTELHGDMEELAAYVKEEAKAARAHAAQQAADLRSEFDEMLETHRREVDQGARQHRKDPSADPAAQPLLAQVEAMVAQARAQKESAQALVDQNKHERDAFEKSVASNLSSVLQHLRRLDEQVAEHAVQHRRHAKTGEKLETLQKCAGEVENLKAGFSDHVATFKAHLQRQSQRAVETAAAIQQLIEMTDTSRAAVSSEIAAVKDWAVRCLQRLRKKIELAAQQVRVVKDGCASVEGQVSRFHASSERNQQLLSELLTQQAQKAAVLGHIVDHELDKAAYASPHQQQHHQPCRQPQPAYAAARSSSLPAAAPPRPVEDPLLDAPACRSSHHCKQAKPAGGGHPSEDDVARRAQALNEHYNAAKQRVKSAQKRLSHAAGDAETRETRVSRETRHRKRREQVSSQLRDLAFSD